MRGVLAGGVIAGAAALAGTLWIWRTPQVLLSGATHAADPAALADNVPPPMPRTPPRPFVRSLEGSTWTVQVASTKDALDAELAREWFARQGELAFVLSAEVRGERWHRVLIGRYPTRADAEDAAARLGTLLTATRPAR